MHTHYMSLALQLAAQGRLTVSPNPMVGCVIVKNNQIIGQGFHQYRGGPHAEVIALQQAGSAAKDADVYVTLEPCCHYGKTPPCTNALIDAGVKNVYVACLDPNPLVKGKGIELLKLIGMNVEVGLFEKEASALNEIFFHYMIAKKPFVIAKWAMSLDGKTAVNDNDDKQISNEHSKQITHELRQQVDAILVGANTVLTDNPQLTNRCHPCDRIEHQPVRVILAGKKYFPENLNVLTSTVGKTIIATTKTTLPYVSHLNVETLLIPENDDQQIHLPSLLDELAKKDITSLLVEGGMTVHQSFLKENLINKLCVHLAPKLIATLPKKKFIRIQQSYQAGDDFHFIANLEENSYV